MRKKQQQEIVRPITTGHVEADMLGQLYLWISERKNRGLSQRPHRNKLKGYTFLNRSEVARMIHKGTSTAPSACWRNLKVLKGKGKEIYSRVASKVRKLFLNGK